MFRSSEYPRACKLRLSLLERLAKKPVAPTSKERCRALDGHLCRCTGYIKYHEAACDVILAGPGRYLVFKAPKRSNSRPAPK
jgi:xanthine dehydrogenase iron-sulfur cluster and FAD-binding subunit A